MNRFLLTLFIAITLTAIRAQSRVTFYTNFGQFNAELYDSIKPITAGNFIQLADSGFYDGEEFYRVWDGFVIQGGSFWGSGTIIPDEFDSTGTLSNVKHTLSMANAGPNTGTSEFFINLKNNTFLDWNKAPLTSAHPVFGLVKDGWNIVDSIAKTPVIDSNKRPITPVVIDSIRVTGSYISVETIELMRTATAIYPNPVTQQTILDIYAPKNQVASVLICDALGQVISDIEIELTAGKSKIPLYTLLSQPLPTGIYLVHIQQESSLFTERILVE